MTIRDATEFDLPAIFEILNHEILTSVNTFKLEVLTSEQQQAWWRLHTPERYPVIVAQSESESILGWASLSPWSLAAGGYHCTSEVSIWVGQQHRGLGVGKRLFASLIQAARRIGYRVLLSKVEASNQASLALHRRFGFTEVGTMHRVGDKFDRELDVVILQNDLQISQQRES